MVTGQAFEVKRRVYVDFEGISLRRKFLTGLEPESINMVIGKLLGGSSPVPCSGRRPPERTLLIRGNADCFLLLLPGSLQIEELGVLTELSASRDKLFPVGFQ